MTRKLGNTIILLTRKLGKGVKMENNDNKSSEITEDANVQLTREEILESSRKENKQGDEREQDLYNKGVRLAYSLGVLLIGIITIVNTIVLNKIPTEIWIVYMGMTTVWSLYYGIKADKRRPLFLACGIICSIVCVFWIVYWILGLCGVVL